MKKSIYLAAFAALALSACSSDNDGIFDQSAADRLEQYKKDYAEVLTADGGLWTMEYFSNADEPGYLFVMKFDKNGSVEISANHKWIDDEFKQETSLWKMIADNGPVLSFNSYNKLFHIFSDPANIEGPNAPTGDFGDIDETGFGHEGDYEFQVMEVSDDGQTVRLLGKKTLYNIYLRRLDPSTDVKTYMDDYKTLSTSLFCKEIPNILFSDADGERYVVTDAYTGIMNIYPENGDAVDQTRSSNFIITNSGIRFMKPFEILASDGTEKTITEFKLVGNNALASVDNENSIISAGYFTEMLYNNKAKWKIDLKSLKGSAKDVFDAFTAELKTLYNYKSASVTDMAFEYDEGKKSYLLRVNAKISAKSTETDKFFVTFQEVEGGVKLSIGDAYDNNSQLALAAYTSLQDFFSLLSSSAMEYSCSYDCAPNSVLLNVNGGELTINAY